MYVCIKLTAFLVWGKMIDIVFVPCSPILVKLLGFFVLPQEKSFPYLSSGKYRALWTLMVNY